MTAPDHLLIPDEVLLLESIQETEDDLDAGQVDAHLFGEKQNAPQPLNFFR